MIGGRSIGLFFTHTDEQMSLALESKRRLTDAMIFEAPIVTEILSAPTFYPAEFIIRIITKPTHFSTNFTGTARPGSVFRTRLGTSG